jgi:hypothetical protein
MIETSLKDKVPLVTELHTLAKRLSLLGDSLLPLDQTRNVYQLLRNQGVWPESKKSPYFSFRLALEAFQDSLSTGDAKKAWQAVFKEVNKLLAQAKSAEEGAVAQSLRAALDDIRSALPAHPLPALDREIYQWAKLVFSGPAGFGEHILQPRDESVGNLDAASFRSAVGKSPGQFDSWSKSIEAIVAPTDSPTMEVKNKMLALLKALGTDWPRPG